VLGKGAWQCRSDSGGTRQGDDDGQAADDLHHMTAPDQSPVGFRNCLRRCREESIARSHAQLLRFTMAHCGRGGGEEDVFRPVSAMSAWAPTATAQEIFQSSVPQVSPRSRGMGKLRTGGDADNACLNAAVCADNLVIRTDREAMR
jgi:hypothetical protein